MSRAPGGGADLFSRPWTFLRGIARLEDLPPPGPPEIAFAGRSNVGKSSLINAVLAQKGLARTSNTPGRTQELNIFIPETGADRLPAAVVVDMPGYGYAAAPKAKVVAWTEMVLCLSARAADLEAGVSAGRCPPRNCGKTIATCSTCSTGRRSPIRWC